MIPLGSQWLDIRLLDAAATGDHLRLATLGPLLTSSDFASRYFTGLLERQYGLTGEVLIHSSFEDAAQSVLEDRASALVVANAYSGINTFYMDRRFALAAVFIHPTPPYGLAALPGAQPVGRCRIAVHPACVPLLKEMVPSDQPYEAVLASSTSAAAGMVRRQEVEMALTNAEVVEELGLRFVSHTRRIQMVWSVFVCAGHTPGKTHDAAAFKPAGNNNARML